MRHLVSVSNLFISCLDHAGLPGKGKKTRQTAWAVGWEGETKRESSPDSKVGDGESVSPTTPHQKEK